MESQLKKEYSEKWFDMILKNKDKIQKFGIVGFNLNLTNEIVLDNLNENWDWYVLMNYNKNITIKKKDLPKNYDKFNYNEINYDKINYDTINYDAINYDATPSSIYFKFMLVLLTMNEKLTLKIIKDSLDKLKGQPEGLLFDWNVICRNNLEYDCKKYITKCTKNVLLMKILKAKKIS